MNIRITFQLFLLAAVLLLYCGCGIKLKGAKKGDGASVETFLVGNGVIQYFVKPLTFTSRGGNMLVDFTFRGNQDSLYKAKVNLTIGGQETGKIDSFKLVPDDPNSIIMTALITGATPMKKGLRYFSDVDNKALNNLFASGQNFKIITYSKQAEQIFHPIAKSSKKIRRIPSILINN